MKKDQSKDRGKHIIPIIERAASDLSLLAMNASDTQVEEVVAAFSQQLKRKVKSVSELPGSGQDALLRRESQGTELSKLVANFVKLPEATRNKVVDMQFGRLFPSMICSLDDCCDFGLKTLSCLRPRRNLQWNDLMRCCTFGLRVQPRLHFQVRGVAHGYGINYSLAKVDGASVTRLMVLQPQG